jgi:surface antigen
MNKMLLGLGTLGLIIGLGLTACSTDIFSDKESRVTNQTNTNAGTTNASGASIGGNIQSAMDEIDKSKMSKALDSAIGKPTHWTNENTGIAYTVTPTEKVNVSGYTFCRKYTATATKGEHEQQTSGTACIGADSNWQSI